MSPTWGDATSWATRPLTSDGAPYHRHAQPPRTDMQNCAMTLGTGAMSGSSSIVAKGTEGHRKPLLKQLWTAVVASGVVP